MIRADHVLLLAGATCAGFGLAGLALVSTAGDGPAPVRFDAAVARDAPLSDADPRPWGALFGTPAPEPDAAPEPARPAPAPDYTLRGLVAAGDGGWAIVAGPEGDTLVRNGSALPGDATVTAIDGSGVTIRRNGETLLIGFSEADIQPADTASAPQATQEATVSLREIRENDFRRMLGLAGGVQVYEYDDGLLAQEIVWVRNGRLYDRIGLTQGDIVLTINGYPAGDTEAIRGAAAELAQQREFRLDIIRAGARMTLKVLVDEDA